jgi:hypothetical protein
VIGILYLLWGIALDRLVHLGGLVPGAPNARAVRVGVEVTTRVLTEASISGKIDHLRGLKENVTMGRVRLQPDLQT